MTDDELETDGLDFEIEISSDGHWMRLTLNTLHQGGCRLRLPTRAIEVIKGGIIQARRRIAERRSDNGNPLRLNTHSSHPQA